MLVKCILLSLLITSVIYHMMIYKEPVTLQCCGGVLRGVHYSETDTSPPKMIRRCFEKDRSGPTRHHGKHKKVQRDAAGKR